jgi:glucose/arabinose dehydrogenase
MSLKQTLVVTGYLGVVTALVMAQQAGVDPRPGNAPDQKPAFAGQTDAPEQKSGVAYEVVPVAEGFGNPWALAFLPDGRMLVTEKPGRLRIVSTDGKMSEPVSGLPAVDARGQGGLLDVVLDPQFATNRLIYWSFSEPQPDKTNNTAVARGRLVDDAAAPRLENVQVIFHQTPSLASRLHFGSRLVWSRDGTLFVTMGDRSDTPGRMQAQNMDSLIGKIARINADGSVPKDNPFVGKPGVKPEIWSIGHRNIQSAALHPATGELWEVEHGTRGGDELNVVRKGRDYGWPTIAYGIEYDGKPILQGITQKDGMEQPVYYWDPVIAPSGMLFYTGSLFPAWNGNLFIGGLTQKDPTNLTRLVLKGDRVVAEERLLTEIVPRERLRDVRQGPDGPIYVVTDGPKGRIFKIVPKK